MRVTLLFVSVAVVAIAACKHDKIEPLAMTSAPSHGACAADSDCTFWLELDPSTCCYDPAKASAQSAKYMRWSSLRVASSECASANCVSLPPPAPPPPGACWNTPRCNAGTCGDACGDH